MLEHLRRREPTQIHNLGVDFGPIHHDLMQENQALLPLSIASMQESFASGLAFAHTEMIDGRSVAVGYSRLIPLLTREQTAELGLPDEFPSIAELGTVYVRPAFRGRNIGAEVQRELLRQFLGKIQQDELLIIGTTKTAKELHLLEKMRDIGVNFHAGRHTEFPHLAPVTCVCVPEFGSGFQFGAECPERVNEEEAAVIREALPQRGIIMLRDVSNGSSDKIPCTMFVSDKGLAERTDRMIADAYGGGQHAQSAFVGRLDGIQYFPYE